MSDTIFALSSGAPPAAIAIVRISGPKAESALLALAGRKLEPRRSSVCQLRDADAGLLDQALVLWLPGPATATGEDVVEFHLHGGRAVVAAVERTLAAIAGLRRAEPGEFTRRAFTNGRIDLAEAEGLADLLSAETEMQRQQALSLAGGKLSGLVTDWRDEVLQLSAEIEASLDFGDEDDVEQLATDFAERLTTLANTISTYLNEPRAETLRDGFRVVLAGPPNSGKSSLFNKLVEEEAAITAPIAGTTRDVLVRAVSLDGLPFVLCDTAGLRDDAADGIEAIGISRAMSELDRADLVLWLGDQGAGQGRVIWEVESFADSRERRKECPRHSVSAVSEEGLISLRRDLISHARTALPKPGTVALNRRQADLLTEATEVLREASCARDLLVCAEFLRVSRLCFDRLLGASGTEQMLDTLFGRFCIGK
jgi:tRNA modification GTPase